MEISAASFLHLLRNISEAVSRNEMAIDFDNLLLEIFAERAPYDKALADSEMRSKLGGENFPSEKVFGRDREKVLLSKLLIGPVKKRIQLFVIPILGGCGIGKTTLAQMVYEDVVVKKHFQVRAWVKVDGQEFRLQNVAQEILQSAMGMSCSLDELEELDEMVRDTLQEQRCLVVFDGIESMTKESWLHMNQHWFDFVDLGSKVLITTPSKDVADLVANQPFELTQLSPDVGLSMCRYLAFGSSEGVENILSPMVKNLSALCQGIPLSLKLVGSLMRYDAKLRNLLSSVDFSDRVLLAPSDASVAILLCVWALPPQLRQCFAYCALFPKGFALNKEKIIDMWIADDLVKPSPGSNSLHDIGDSYFRQLLCRSFFTDIACNQYGDITEFRMPCLIHKIAQDVARIVYKGKLGLIGSIGEDAGQLSLVLPFAGKYKSEHLRTLILSPTLYLGGGNLDHSLLEFKGLQSLDLSCSGIRNLSDDIRALKELRYLNLSCTLIERVPDSITDLSQLQTLDLSWCYHLKLLPKGMCNLMHMSHLDLSLCESLSYLPSGIGFLISLCSMPLFVLGKNHDCASLGELGWLNQLRGRLEITNLENVREINEARNAKLDQKYLHHLGLSWSHNADDCFEVLELLQPNPHLKVLNLTGYMGFGFPSWITSINSLINISITDCGCKKLPSLGQLRFLKELELKGMTKIESIGEEFYGDGVTDVFPSLERLGLYDMPRLLEWSSASGGSASGSGGSASCMFRSLKTLTIESCPHLARLPTLLNLPELIVWDSNHGIFSFLTSFRSLSSLLIKDMRFGISFIRSSRWSLLKKLILFNIEDLDTSFIFMGRFTALKHLGILHCHQLSDISLDNTISLQKLHVVDCRNLMSIDLAEEITMLIELVVEDCPQAISLFNLRNLRFLRKLIIRHSVVFILDAEDLGKLEKLQYLSINGCPLLENQLEMKPSLISHIPCVILRNRKANYKDSKDFGEVPIPISALFESKHNPKRESESKVSSPLSSGGLRYRQIPRNIPTVDDHSPAGFWQPISLRDTDD